MWKERKENADRWILIQLRQRFNLILLFAEIVILIQLHAPFYTLALILVGAVTFVTGIAIGGVLGAVAVGLSVFVWKDTSLMLLDAVGMCFVIWLGHHHRKKKEEIRKQHHDQIIPWDVSNEIRNSLAAVRFLLFPTFEETQNKNISIATEEIAKIEKMFNEMEQKNYPKKGGIKMNYVQSVMNELKKNKWNGTIVIIFTICRFFVGWAWFKAGWDKIVKENWLGDGKFDAGGFIQKMVTSLKTAHGTDPLHLNNLLIWFANHVFYPMGGFLDFLVIAFEILIGLFIFFGFGMMWTMIAAMFLNLQYITAGSANNFGYLATDIVWFKFPTYAGCIGIDGYLRYKKEKPIL